MLIGSLVGAVAALALALLVVTRPRLAFRAAHLFEGVGQGRSEAVLRLFLALAVLGGIVGALARI